MPLLLTTFRDKDFSIDELVAVARDLIEEASISQGRWKVSQHPDARTVRYYMSTGVLKKPSRYEGTAARFDYDHLLKLLAIKALQARFLPLQRIKELIGAKHGQDLERIVLEILPGMSEGESTSERHRADFELRHSDLPTNRSTADLPLRLAVGSSETAASDESVTWERLEVESGLELHVRSDYRSPTTSSGMNALLSKLRGLLELRTMRPLNPEESNTPSTQENRRRATGS
jgi:DNA-binding transcriptional MerR regulator